MLVKPYQIVFGLIGIIAGIVIGILVYVFFISAF